MMNDDRVHWEDGSVGAPKGAEDGGGVGTSSIGGVADSEKERSWKVTSLTRDSRPRVSRISCVVVGDEVDIFQD